MDKQKLEQAIKLLAAWRDGGTMQWDRRDRGWETVEVAACVTTAPESYRVVRADGSIVCGSDLSAVVFTLDEIEAWLATRPMPADKSTDAVMAIARAMRDLRDPQDGLAASAKKGGE